MPSDTDRPVEPFGCPPTWPLEAAAVALPLAFAFAFALPLTSVRCWIVSSSLRALEAPHSFGSSSLSCSSDSSPGIWTSSAWDHLPFVSPVDLPDCDDVKEKWHVMHRPYRHCRRHHCHRYRYSTKAKTMPTPRGGHDARRAIGGVCRAWCRDGTLQHGTWYEVAGRCQHVAFAIRDCRATLKKESLPASRPTNSFIYSSFLGISAIPLVEGIKRSIPVGTPTIRSPDK